MCQALFYLQGIKWQMRDLAPVLVELVFYEWVYQSEFSGRKGQKPFCVV